MRIDASELNLISADLAGADRRVTSQAARFTRETAVDIETLAKQLVPKITRTLMRSIHHTMSRGGLAAEIGTDVEYARRVELGFIGTDSLGRVYDQAPRAYLGPAFDRHAPGYVEGLAKLGADGIFR